MKLFHIALPKGLSVIFLKIIAILHEIIAIITLLLRAISITFLGL